MGDRRGAQGASSSRCGRPAASPASCASSASASTASSASTPRRARPTGRRIPAGNTKKIAETFREACDVAEDHGERLAAEGEICWGGMHSWKREGRTARSRSAGRRPSASRPTWRTRCSSPWATTRPRRPAPAGELRLEGPGAARRGAAQDDRRPAALDHRFPRRAERRHGERLRLARQDRPPLPADRSQRQARHRPKHAGYWLRDESGNRPRRSSTSAGTAACSPTTVMIQQQTWNDILARHDQGARRAWLA